MTKPKKVDTLQAEGEKNKEAGGDIIPVPSVDEYVVFYYISWQPGVPDDVYKFQTTLW